MTPTVDFQTIFETEALRSERQRVIGVLPLLAILGLFVVVRGVLGDSDAQLETAPLPLGVMADLEFDAPRQRKMNPGDLLVLVTDGFFEWARSDGTQYGTERLNEFICQNAALPARELIAGLHESVRSFVGESPQQDDLTAVVVKRTG